MIQLSQTGKKPNLVKMAPNSGENILNNLEAIQAGDLAKQQPLPSTLFYNEYSN